MKKDAFSLAKIRKMFGSVADSVHGGKDVDINDLEGPPPVTDETEEAYKEAQRKKGEHGGSDSRD